MQIVPASEGMTAEDIEFSWDIKSFKSTGVEFELNFNTPEMLSQDPLDTDDMLMTFCPEVVFL